MREQPMITVPDPESSEPGTPPYLDPETPPALSTTPGEIAYLCGDCGVRLAELAEGLRPRFAIVCPDCGSFNAFPEFPET